MTGTTSSMPTRGFGTWPMQGDECRRAVEIALEVGYRHIDTALMYRNHDAIRASLESVDLLRRDIFITSKVPPEQLRYPHLIDACKRSLDELGTDYLDLFLIHWPNPKIPIVESLQAMAFLIEQRLIRHCGVSNFSIAQVAEACSVGIAPILTNQIECHPYLENTEMVAFCREQGVTITAYSPLALGRVNDDPVLLRVGGRYGRTPAQIALRWLLQLDIVAIPKASSREHITDNFGLQDFELTAQDMTEIVNSDRSKQ